jgi:c-di-GMP-binding flagellar brake protein YcgR
MAESLATEPNVSRVLSRRGEIIDAMRTVALQRLELSLRVAGFSNGIRVRIHRVDDDTLVLSELTPRISRDALLQSPSFVLTGRGNGLYVFASDLVLRKRAKHNADELEAEMPEQLIYQQRRRMPRATLPARAVAGKGARLQLRRGKETIDGTIVDISTGGCRVRIDTDPPPSFTVGDVINHCDVRLTQNVAFSSAIAIRHTALNHSTNQLFCGIEFLTLTADSSRTLERFVARVAVLTAKLAPEALSATPVAPTS